MHICCIQTLWFIAVSFCSSQVQSPNFLCFNHWDPQQQSDVQKAVSDALWMGLSQCAYLAIKRHYYRCSCVFFICWRGKYEAYSHTHTHTTITLKIPLETMLHLLHFGILMFFWFDSPSELPGALFRPRGCSPPLAAATTLSSVVR